MLCKQLKAIMLAVVLAHSTVAKSSTVSKLLYSCQPLNLKCADQRYTAVVYGVLAAKVPPALNNSTDVAMLCGGTYHALALLSNGTVISWTTGEQDANAFGQATVPVWRSAGRTAVYVTAAANVSAAILDDKSLVVWGESTAPTFLSGLEVAAVALGSFHILIVHANGTLLTAGDNSVGQLNVPFDLLHPGIQIRQVAAGATHSLALTQNGRVFAWGSDNVGQVSLPTSVRAGGITHIAAGPFASYAMYPSGPNGGNRVLFWGKDDGQSAVQELEDVLEIAAGQYHVVARTAAGVVYTFGDNTHGQVRSGVRLVHARILIQCTSQSEMWLILLSCSSAEACQPAPRSQKTR
jgi:alpha-tubulin suppressor-like RCC1 family protein